jgi:hypothetical protein
LDGVAFVESSSRYNSGMIHSEETKQNFLFQANKGELGSVRNSSGTGLNINKVSQDLDNIQEQLVEQNKRASQLS